MNRKPLTTVAGTQQVCIDLPDTLCQPAENASVFRLLTMPQPVGGCGEAVAAKVKTFTTDRNIYISASAACEEVRAWN